MDERTAAIHRVTKETDIKISLNLNGQGQSQIATGIGFYDHMLTALIFHALFDAEIQAAGDLHIDAHHTIEDVAIVLGQAINEAVGDKRGINRVGHAYVPMDEALGFVTVDLSGRPYTVFQAQWKTGAIGQFPTDLVQHFFETLAVHAKLSLHARVDGRNDHHKAESLFKALGRSLCSAVAADPRRFEIPSTKGTLD